jgi:hypothetical protein
MAKHIPIKAAKVFLEQHNLDQVIIVGRQNQADGMATDYMVTYGKTKADCEAAGIAGDHLKGWMGLPKTLLSKYSRKENTWSPVQRSLEMWLDAQTTAHTSDLYNAAIAYFKRTPVIPD